MNVSKSITTNIFTELCLHVALVFGSLERRTILYVYNSTCCKNTRDIILALQGEFMYLDTM